MADMAYAKAEAAVLGKRFGDGKERSGFCASDYSSVF